MYPVINQILRLFGFTEYQVFIAVFCMVVLLGNFLGGLLRSIVLAYSGPLKRRKLTETVGFRLAMASELILILFAFYYHAALIGTVDASHVIFWAFTLMSSPVLAYMGSQITFLIYQKKIEQNYKNYRKIQALLRERKRQAAEATAKAEKTKNSAKRFNPSGVK